MIVGHAEDMVDFYSADDIDSMKAENSSFTKWIPAEWGYSDGNNSELNKISKILYDMSVPILESSGKCINDSWDDVMAVSFDTYFVVKATKKVIGIRH